MQALLSSLFDLGERVIVEAGLKGLPTTIGDELVYEGGLRFTELRLTAWNEGRRREWEVAWLSSRVVVELGTRCYP
jgi:hypothetical protein